MPQPLILLLLILSNVSALSKNDHGKVVHFHRIRRLWLLEIPYVHKAIIIYPSEFDCTNCTTFDGVPLETDRPYVIHLWSTSQNKAAARVRIDPFEIVAAGGAYEILDDPENALPAGECIHRALFELGLDHRGIGYDFIRNNCGNFVFWAKMGYSEADTQFWDALKKYSKKIPSGKVPKLLDRIQKRVHARYRPKDWVIEPDSLIF